MIGCLACALFPRFRGWALWDDYAGPPVSAVSFCAAAGFAGSWCMGFLAQGLGYPTISEWTPWLGVLTFVVLIASFKRDWSRGTGKRDK